MPAEEPRGNIYSRIAAVQAEAPNIQKKGVNTYHNYKYTREEDILDGIKPVLTKHGLAIIPIGAEHVNLTLPDSKNINLLVTITYLIADVVSGESIQVKGFGQGQDNGDKAVYKANTGALKQMLAKTFLISTGDDPEEHARQEEKKKAAAVAARPALQELKKEVPGATSAERITNLAKALGKPEADVKKMLRTEEGATLLRRQYLLNTTKNGNK